MAGRLTEREKEEMQFWGVGVGEVESNECYVEHIKSGMFYGLSDLWNSGQGSGQERNPSH